MASAPPPFASTKETTNYARLCRLLVDVGSQALRDTFDGIHPPANLYGVLTRPPAHPTLQSLRKKRILNATQWGKLYPTIPSSVSSANFDITLLMLLLRNICGLSPPASTGSWDVLPPATDLSIEANIARVKFYRNNVYGHASQASVANPTFHTYWQDISNALVGLGAGASYGAAINRLKTESMDPDMEEHYRELLKEWKKDDDSTKDKLVEIEEILKQWKTNEESTKDKLGEMEEVLKQLKIEENSTKNKLEEMEEMLKQWRTNEDSATGKLEEMEEVLTKWRKDEGSTTEKLGEMEEMLRRWKTDEGSTKDKLDGMEEMLTQWKKDEDSIKTKLKDIEEMLKQWKTDESNSKDKLQEMGEKIKEELEEVKSKMDTISEKMENLVTSEQASKDEGAFKPAELIDGFRQLYKVREGWLAPFPWCEEFRFHLDSIFTRLKMVSRRKERGTKTEQVVDMSDIFKPHKECSRPRTVLIEGKPGMGKTTYCNKLAYDWAIQSLEVQGSFPKFQVVLLIKCRDIKSDLWEAIDDQLLPRDIQEKEKDEFFKFLRHNQSNVLLILDGLDESPPGKLEELKEIIQGRMLLKCHLVVTAREEVGVKVRECCDTLLEIEGFTEEDARKFITKYFKNMEDLAEKLLDKLKQDRILRGLTANPLNTALFCLLCDDFKGVFPESRTELYLEIVQCVLTRYRKKKELPETKEDLIGVYKVQLKYLGSIALNCLLKDSMYFEDRQLQNVASDLSGFGFLSVQPGSSKRRPSVCYGFLHKSFQELFAAFYLCCQLLDGEISPESLLEDTRYFRELRQVLLFTCGMLAAQCEETALALIKCIASQVNKGDTEDFETALDCINECKKEQNNQHIELARVLGSHLQLQSVDFRWTTFIIINDAQVAALAEAIQRNSTLTDLDLSDSSIADAGATALAEAIQTNSTLTVLHLSENIIADAGATALAKAIQTKSTLTVLCLNNNRICDAGATALAKAIQRNSMLTVLDLSDNCIADGGATALAEAIQTNSTLRVLDLSHNRIADAGATALAIAIQTNSTLTALHLSDSGIADAGATALAEAIQTNSTLTLLNLSDNGIADAGATALAEAIQTNSTLTELDLSHNRIADAGATALAIAIQNIGTHCVLDLC